MVFCSYSPKPSCSPVFRLAGLHGAKESSGGVENASVRSRRRVRYSKLPCHACRGGACRSYPCLFDERACVGWTGPGSSAAHLAVPTSLLALYQQYHHYTATNTTRLLQTQTRHSTPHTQQLNRSGAVNQNKTVALPLHRGCVCCAAQPCQHIRLSAVASLLFLRYAAAHYQR